MQKIIEQELERIAQSSNRLIALEGPLGEISSVMANRPELSPQLSVSVGYGVSVSLSINVKKIREVVPVLRALAKQGIHINKTSKPRSHQWGRTYTLNLQSAQIGKNGLPRMETMDLTCYVESMNATCKYVKVGEKTIDIMEWQCLDEQEPAPALGDAL